MNLATNMSFVKRKCTVKHHVVVGVGGNMDISLMDALIMVSLTTTEDKTDQVRVSFICICIERDKTNGSAYIWLLVGVSFMCICFERDKTNGSAHVWLMLGVSFLCICIEKR